MTRVAIIQSNYIPWIGYFEIISTVSHFVFLDNVQYTSRDWRNRNQIKTPQGKMWLTINVKDHNKQSLIEDIRFESSNWKSQHLEAIRRNYRRAAHFEMTYQEIEEMYFEFHGDSLSKLNQHLVRSIASKLGIVTQFHNSSDFITRINSSQRLLDICQMLNAKTYVSGPSARSYLDLDLFGRSDVSVEWFNYSERTYNQLWGGFEKGVSVIDPILNNGWDVLKSREEAP